MHEIRPMTLAAVNMTMDEVQNGHDSLPVKDDLIHTHTRQHLIATIGTLGALASLSVGCTAEKLQQTWIDLQEAWDRKMCRSEEISEPSLWCGTAITAPPPSVKEVAQQMQPKVSLGEPLDKNIGAAVETALKLYPFVEDVLASPKPNEETVIGKDFTAGSLWQQEEAAATLIHAAHEDGLTVNLEIGPGTQFVPCTGPGSICVKIQLPDSSAYYYPDIYHTSGGAIGDNQTQTALFYGDIHNWAQNKNLRESINHAIMISPYPFTHKDNPLNVGGIAKSVETLLAPGGTYVIYLNPAFNSQYGYGSYVITEDMIKAIEQNLQNSSIDSGTFEEMLKLYPEIVMRNVPSSLFGSAELQQALVVVIHKNKK